eukprot:1161859-Pelagomonas_calceolata.AAC.17
MHRGNSKVRTQQYIITEHLRKGSSLRPGAGNPHAMRAGGIETLCSPASGMNQRSFEGHSCKSSEVTQSRCTKDEQDCTKQARALSDCARET